MDLPEYSFSFEIHNRHTQCSELINQEEYRDSVTWNVIESILFLYNSEAQEFRLNP